MDRFNIYALFFIASWGCVLTNTPVMLYTDLIHVIASDGNCSAVIDTERDPNKTIEVKAGSFPLTPFSFYKVSKYDSADKTCEKEDITKTSFANYMWVCFSSGNGGQTLRGANWFFLDCATADFISISCLTIEESTHLMNKLCNSALYNSRCVTFSTSDDGKNHTCSQKYTVKKKQIVIENDELSYVSPFDIAAYLCAAFILVCFLLAVCIPAEKCKPTYKCEKEAERRVPLEIYEMYGAKYKPSAKRQLTANAEKWKRKLSRLLPHNRNVALMANTEHDSAYRTNGRKSSRQKKRGSKHVTIVSDVFQVDDMVAKLKHESKEESAKPIDNEQRNTVQTGEQNKVAVFNKQQSVGFGNLESPSGLKYTTKRRSSTC